MENISLNNGFNSFNQKYDMLNSSFRETGKYVLVKESNEAPMTLKPTIKAGENGKSKDYILEGIFAFFGRENENGRIYEEEEYLPHLEYLMDKVKKQKLLGELDHPKEFDISLSNVSHIIEDLWLDKEKRVLRGRIKVLTDTPRGQILKALIDNGVPVSISSRAAGLVENNKKVKIKRIFTYDVVGDAGFGDEAELGRIYESINYHPTNDIKKYANISESLGINNKTIQIFDLGGDEQKLKALLEKTTVKEMNYVSEKDFNAYTDMMKKYVQSLEAKVTLFESSNPALKNNHNSDSESDKEVQELKTELLEMKAQMAKMNKYHEHLFENLKNVKVIAEDAAKYQDHLFENLKSTKELISKLESDVEFDKKYVDHIFENLSEAKKEIEVNGQYFNHVYENLSKFKKELKVSEAYQMHLFENLKHAKSEISVSEQYQAHLFENLQNAKNEIDFNNKYSEHLYECAKTLLNEGKISTAYMQHLKNNISVLNEGKTLQVQEAKPLNESVSISFDDKIESLLQAAKNKEVAKLSSQPNYNFFSVISEKLQQDFLSLDETKKQKVVKALADKKWSKEEDIINIMNEALVDHIDENKKWLVEMPEAFKAKWENLSESKKAEIAMQTANYPLNSAYQIKWFWETRNLDESIGFIPLNENKSNEPFKIAPSGLGYTIDDSLLNSIGKAFNK